MSNRSGAVARLVLITFILLGAVFGANAQTCPPGTIAPPVITAPAEVCPYGNGPASVAPPAPGQSWEHVSWSITNGSFGYGPFGQMTTADGTDVTIYGNGSGDPIVLTAHVYDFQMCESQSSRTVNVRTIDPPVITAPAQICPYGNGVASVAPPSEGGNWDYVSWTITNGSFGYGISGPLTTASGASVTFYGNGSGDPIVLRAHVYDNQMCESESTTTVTARTIQPPAITAPAEICPYGNGVASVAPPSEGGNWDYVSWTITNGSFGYGMSGPLTTASGTSVTFYGNGSGDPIVLTSLVYDNQFCQVQSTKTVAGRTIDPPAINAPAQICPYGNGPASVAPPAGGGNWDYVSWTITHGSFGYGPNGPLTTASGANVTFYGDGSGLPIVLSALVYDNQFCQTQATTTVGTQGIDPPAITAPASICSTGSSPASVAPPAGGGAWENVSWSITNGNFGLGAYGPLTYANGPYVVFYADGSGNPIVLQAHVQDTAQCDSTGTVTIPVSALTPEIVVTPRPIVPSATTTATVVPPAQGTYTSYHWTVEGGSISSGENAATMTFLAYNAGPVTVGVTVDDGTGCSGSASGRYALAGQPLVIDGPATFCSTSATKNASLFAEGTLSSIVWSVANGTIAAGQGTAALSFIP